MGIDFLCWLVALICFALATAGVPAPRVQIGWLGAFFIALAEVLHVATSR